MPLAMKLDLNNHEEQLGWLVSDFTLPNRNWDFNKLNFVMSHEHREKILRIPLIINDNICDALTWNCSNLGNFSIKLAYSFIVGDEEKPNILEWVWKITCMERVHIFIWKAMKQSLLTNTKRFWRGMSGVKDCPRCGEVEETMEHLFRQCSFAQ